MLFTVVSRDQKERLRNGDIVLLKKLLQEEEKLLINRLLNETQNTAKIQGAGLFLQSLRKLIDPSNTTQDGLELLDSGQYNF